MLKKNLFMISCFFILWGCAEPAAHQTRNFPGKSRASSQDEVPEWFLHPASEEGFVLLSGRAMDENPIKAEERAINHLAAQWVYAGYAARALSIPLQQFIAARRNEIFRQGFFLKQISEIQFPFRASIAVVQKDSDWMMLDERKITIAYVVGKIPLDALRQWEAQIAREMSRPGAKAMISAAFALMPDKSVRPLPRLGEPMRKLYAAMGFEVQNPVQEFKPGEINSFDELLAFLRRRMAGRVRRGVFCFAAPKEVSREIVGRTEITTVFADLSFQELDPVTGKENWKRNFPGQGVSLEKEPLGILQAFDRFLRDAENRILDLGEDLGLE